ncbi:MAG: DUF2339 domain-containing protein, partial [Opitutaceae bacterium]
PPSLPRREPVAVPPPLPGAAAAFGSAPAPVPPQPPRPLFPPASTGAEEPSPFARFLGAAHLLPPAGEGAGEVQLGAWWATRIGALLVVLAVVFFGVYVSIGTPPWVKLAELGAVSVAIALAGAWLEKKTGRFGSVILGSGLALIFFTAFAAYAIPPVKVTDSLPVSLALQTAAVAIVFGISIRRNSPTVATMAIVLGFVSAFFSVSEGFDDFAVFGALALAAVSVGLRKWRGWGTPVLFAAGLTHVIVASVAISIWDTEVGARGAVFVFGVVFAAFAVFFLSAVLEGPGVDGRFSRVQRWLQSLNGSLGAIAGFIAATTVLSGGDLSGFLFAAGVILVLAAVWAWRVAPADLLMTAFAVKASALMATGVMIEWEARTRWAALLAEAFVLLAASHRARRPALAVLSGAVWVLSLLFFLGDPVVPASELLSAAGVVLAVYVLAGPVLLALVLKLLERGAPSIGMALLVGALAMAPSWRACSMIPDAAWGPLAMVFGAALLGMSARALRSHVPIVSAAVMFGWAHAAVQVYSVFKYGSTWLWTSVAAVALTSAAGAWRLIERGDEDDQAVEALDPRLEWLGAALAMAALAAISAGAFIQWPARAALAVAITLAAGVAWMGALQTRRAWQAGGAAASVFVIALWWIHSGSEFRAEGALAWLWMAAAGGVLLLLSVRSVRGVRGGEPAAEVYYWRWISWTASVVSVVLLWTAMRPAFGPIGCAWAGVAGLAGFSVIARWKRFGAAFGAGVLLAGIVMLSIVTAGAWPPTDQPWHALIAAWFLGMGFAILPALAVRAVEWIPLPFAKAWRGLAVIVGALFVLGVSLQRPAAWSSFTTVIWALAGIALFLAGLYCRARSHRLGGLVVLALCIPRVFLVDINSTLYRIAAFVVLGLVLLWVGFSYQRFRHLVEDDERKREGRSTGSGPEPVPRG